MNNNEIIFYIILRQSLQLTEDQVRYCVAESMQQMLLKYFMWQIVSVKSNVSINKKQLDNANKWLASKAKKKIVVADDDIWQDLKNRFSMGTELFVVKDLDIEQIETDGVLILWPLEYDLVPSYLK